MNFTFAFAVFGITVFLIPSSTIAERRITKEQVVAEQSNLVMVKAALEENTVALVNFEDHTIDPEDSTFYLHQFRLIVQKIGENYSRIVLTLVKSKAELFKTTKSSIFLNAVSEENIIRQHGGLKTIMVFFHFSITTSHIQNAIPEIKDLTVGLVSIIKNDGIISGIIFQPAFIEKINSTYNHVYGNENSSELDSIVVKLKKILNTIEYIFGHELSLGLAMNSYNDCVAYLVGELCEVMPTVDFVVFNSTFKDPFVNANGKQYAHLQDCKKLAQKYFQQPDFYHVGESFDINSVKKNNSPSKSEKAFE